MNEFIMKEWQNLKLGMKKILKRVGILLAVQISFIILWFCLSKGMQQEIINFIAVANLWIHNHQIFEKANLFLCYSLRMMILFTLALLIFSIILLFIGVVSAFFKVMIKKEKRACSSRKLKLLEVVISVVVTCLIMKMEFPDIIVEKFLQISQFK